MDSKQNSFGSGQYFTDETYSDAAYGMHQNFATSGLNHNNSIAPSDMSTNQSVFDCDYMNDYAMNGQFNGNNNYMNTFDMSANGMSQSDIDGMTFNPQMFLGVKGREYSNASSESNHASISPQPGPMRSLPLSSNGSDSNSGSHSPVDRQEGNANTARRNRFLERNRLAAAKCRTKKKEWTNNLEAAARQASQQTRELHAIVQNLRNEVQQHKAMLESHQGCDCHPIHEYLTHHANSNSMQ